MFSVCFSGVRFFVRVCALAQHSFLFSLFFLWGGGGGGCWLQVCFSVFVVVAVRFFCLVLFCGMLHVCFSGVRFFVRVFAASAMYSTGDMTRAHMQDEEVKLKVDNLSLIPIS